MYSQVITAGLIATCSLPVSVFLDILFAKQQKVMHKTDNLVKGEAAQPARMFLIATQHCSKQSE